MAFACLDLAVEHQAGIAVLADQPLWGPAFALLGIQFEAFIRGVWLARCATDDQLAWFKDGKLDKHRKFHELVTAVEKALKHDGGALTKLRAQSWAMFNDFTHTGFQHVVRRNSATTTGPNYADPELIGRSFPWRQAGRSRSSPRVRVATDTRMRRGTPHRSKRGGRRSRMPTSCECTSSAASWRGRSSSQKLFRARPCRPSLALPPPSRPKQDRK